MTQAPRGVLSWLFTVVRRTCLRLLRPFARRPVHAVHQAIAELDPQHREVLVLRDLEGLTGAETCSALGLGEAAMKTRLHRARAELRRRLTHAGHVLPSRAVN